MKKILAVLIAIAMVATMAFAADINASVIVKAGGNVAKVEDLSKAVDTVTWLNEKDEGRLTGGAGNGAEVNLVLTTADEKAGATFPFNALRGESLSDDGISLWIKPIDQVKLSFFSTNVVLASDTYFTWGQVQRTDGQYGVTVTPIDGLTIDVITTKDITDGSDPLVAGKVVYAIDGVATVSAVANDDEKFGFAIDAVKVGPVAANAWFTSAAEKYTVYEAATVTVGSVALTEAVKVVDFDKPVVPVYVNAGTTVADVAVACKAVWADIKKDADKLTVTPSATISGAVGAAAWTLGAELPVAIADKTVVSLNIPYSVTMAW